MVLVSKLRLAAVRKQDGYEVSRQSLQGGTFPGGAWERAEIARTGRPTDHVTKRDSLFWALGLHLLELLFLIVRKDFG